MPLDDDVRELIAHALLWAWKDEEMHAIYVRGALLRLGSLRRRVRVFATPGGRGDRRLVHLSPPARALERGAAVAHAGHAGSPWLGMLTGKVPREVLGTCDYGPFRDFCRFNVEAERTAWLCWHRLAELAEADARAAGRARRRTSGAS